MTIEITGYRSDTQQKYREIISSALTALFKKGIGVKLIYQISENKLSVYLQFLSSMDIQTESRIVDQSGLLKLYDYRELTNVPFNGKIGEVCFLARKRYKYTTLPRLLEKMFRSDVLVTHREDVLSSIDIPDEISYYKPIQAEEREAAEVLNAFDGKSLSLEVSIVPIEYDIATEKEYLKHSATLFHKATQEGVIGFLTRSYRSDILEKIFHEIKFNDLLLNKAEKESEALYAAFCEQDVFFTKIALRGEMPEEELSALATILEGEMFSEGVDVYTREQINSCRLPFLYTKNEVDSISRFFYIEKSEGLVFDFGRPLLNNSKILERIKEGVYASSQLTDYEGTDKSPVNLLKKYRKEIIVFDEESYEEAKAKIEEDVLGIVLESLDAIKIYNFDTGISSVRWSLSNLKQYGQFIRIGDVSTLEKSISWLYDEFLSRSDLLDDSIKTIEEYNKKAYVKEDIYILLIDMQTYQQLNKEIMEKLDVIVKNSNALGAYILFYSYGSKTRNVDLQTDISTFLFENDAIVTNQTDLNSIEIDTLAPSNLIKTIQKRQEELSPFKNFLSIPIGYSPEIKKEINFELGEKSEAYHALIVGTIGTGKTTLLNNIIVRIAEQYTSDEVQLILMDYKASGVEFDVFKSHPNVRDLYLDNTGYDDFMKVFRFLQDEMARRGEEFKKHKVTKIDDYNKIPDVPKMPRIILIVDEIQKLFKNLMESYDYRKEILHFVRESRSMGLSLIFATQSLSGLGFDDIIAQIRLRVAFRLSDIGEVRDVFGVVSGNNAPLTLKRFQCIVNNSYGQTDGNIKIATYPEYRKRVELDNYFSYIRETRNGPSIDATIHKKNQESDKSKPQQTEIHHNNELSLEPPSNDDLPFDLLSEEELQKVNNDFFNDQGFNIGHESES